jgi:hypothetical protein
MAQSFGARMRERREVQGIALVTIADRTKIKLSLLDSLEHDDFSHWPTGIFRRAYMRAYAQAIGLDPEAVLHEFLERYPDPAEVFLAEPEAGGAGQPGGPPTRLSYILGAAIGSIARRRPPTVTGGTGSFVRVPREPLERHEPPAPDEGIVATTGSTPAETPAQGGAHAELAPAVDPVAEMPGVPAPGTEDREPVPAASGPEIAALADLCTALGRAHQADEIRPVLQDAARILEASGIIVWMPDGTGRELIPALAHGYSDRVLAYLPSVWTDADNATATAFREQRACVIAATDHQNGALVVPLLTPEGCSGVLALELHHGSEQSASVRACATILAALLAQLTPPAQTTRHHDEQTASGREREAISVVRLRVSPDEYTGAPIRRAAGR